MKTHKSTQAEKNMKGRTRTTGEVGVPVCRSSLPISDSEWEKAWTEAIREIKEEIFRRCFLT